MKDLISKMIEKEKVIAIVRGVDSKQCMRVADALYEGGIRLMEITYDQKNPDSWSRTAGAIGDIIDKYGEKMPIGAGTVTCTELVELTHKAGGKFIISPDTDVDVIKRTVELGMISVPGAMTATEIMTAHRAGANFVKLFPAGSLGAGYLKAVRAPLSHVKLLAVGGISEKNAGEFLGAGAAGLGVGGNLANRTWIEAGEFEKITAAAKALVDSVRAFDTKDLV